MPLTIIIADKKYTPWAGTFTIEDRIEERTTASFMIDDPAGNETFRKGQAVIIEHNNKRIFAGVIENALEKIIDNRLYKRHDISCIDYHYAVDKRLAVKAYENEAAGDIVRDLWESYLAEEGIYNGTPWRVYEGMTWREVIELGS